MLLIDGQLVPGSLGTFPVINPATGEPLGTAAPHASESQVNAAVEAAAVAFKTWSTESLDSRKKYLANAKALLLPHVSELSALLSLEQGKPESDAKSEVESAIAFFAEISKIEIPVQIVSTTATHSLELHRRPLGVVAGIVPWNYPVQIAVMKMAVALVYGNTIVLKPSPNTPLSTLRIGEVIASAFPKGVVNVLTGPDTRDEHSVGDLLTKHPKVTLTSFTGSIATGKRVYGNCAPKLGRMVLELGGNDPAIVLHDADVEKAAQGVLEGGMINCGQICCGIKRVYVDKTIYENFVNRIAELAKLKGATVGPGNAGPHIRLGPLNNRAQRDRVEELVEDAKKNGAKIVAGGHRGQLSGFFYEPTIVTNIAEGVRLVDEEQFGPVLPIMKFDSVDEAVERANNSVFGLGASVWGSDPALVNSVAHRLQAGIVWTNEHAADIPGLPFGGMKWSGVGREGGEFDLFTYTEPQSVKLLRKDTGAAARPRGH